MRVDWTRRAQRRLDRHIAYIAVHSAHAAEDTLDRVLDFVDTLADHPMVGHQGRYIGARELVIEGGRYIAVYRMRSKVVQIVTIHDARQDWPDDWWKA